MPTEDLKSRTPGPLDDDSRAFVDRIASRGQRDISPEEGDPGSEIDETALPLDGSAEAADLAVTDIQGDDDDQPDSDNSNDEGEDETPALRP